MRSSPASIYMTLNLWVDRSTCLASRILSEKESFPGSEFKPASIWTCWMLIGRQICSQRSCWNFTGGFRSWLPATSRHLHASPPGDLLITMVKETVILYKKEFRKMKKSRISPWCERDENAKWLRDCLWLCQACERGFTCWPMWRNLRQEAHSYPQADICSAPLSRS